jgi:aromatic amino acid aminotransferase I / 2-aminoadipate transaminase
MVGFPSSSSHHLPTRLQLHHLNSHYRTGSGTGNAVLRQWCHNFTQRVHRPLRDDFEVLLHAGNTDAWSKVVGMLCEKGEYILTESFTYPSAQALWVPLGNFACPIETDEQGMRADRLRETLTGWGESHPGTPRPHVLYVVSVGSNPSGVTMSEGRRREIYDLCVEFGMSRGRPSLFPLRDQAWNSHI